MSQTNAYVRVRNMIDDITEVLYMDTFTIEDLDGHWEDRQSDVMPLKRFGAVHVVETVKRKRDDASRNKYINKYEWSPRIQGKLQAHIEERDELPCNCRAHIPSETDSNGLYICKFCGSKHPRDVIESAL